MEKNGQKSQPIFSKHWYGHYVLGIPITASKRNRLGVYAVSPDSRSALDIFIRNGLQRRHREMSVMTLENAYRPWWMSFRQYQAMLTRLGLPF